jgi:hypothetical protein
LLLLIKFDHADIALIENVTHPAITDESERLFGMLRQLKEHGMSARFLVFVLATMVGSLIVGSLAAGVASSVRNGDPGYMLLVPFISVVGAGFAVPLAFIMWIVPSALIFSACLSLFEQSIGIVRAAQWSGVITAFVAALAATYVATDFGHDFDGAGSLMFFVGPTAVAIAPWIARKAYSLV